VLQGYPEVSLKSPLPAILLHIERLCHLSIDRVVIHPVSCNNQTNLSSWR
jgi:hypothetical protein